MGAEIKKVVIQIGKLEIELTVEDAKALKEALDGMFEKSRDVITVPYPYPVFHTPWPYWGPGTVIYGSTSIGTGWTAKCADDTQYLTVNT